MHRLPVALHDHLLIKPAVQSRVIMDDVIGQAEVRDVSRELVKWLRTTEGICLPCSTCHSRMGEAWSYCKVRLGIGKDGKMGGGSARAVGFSCFDARLNVVNEGRSQALVVRIILLCSSAITARM